MEHLERPQRLERQLWFQQTHQEFVSKGVIKVSEQASALIIDLEAVFCVGAWATVVLLSGVIVESHIQLTKGDLLLTPKQWEWMRTQRNRLAHEKASKPILTIEDHWQRRDIWEDKAKKAIVLTFTQLYGPNPQ